MGWIVIHNSNISRLCSTWINTLIWIPPKADTSIYVYKWFMRRKISGSMSGGWERWEGRGAMDNPVIVLGRWGSILLEATKGHLECTSELSHQCGKTDINGFKDSCLSSTESCLSGQKIWLLCTCVQGFQCTWMNLQGEKQRHTSI